MPGGMTDGGGAGDARGVVILIGMGGLGAVLLPFGDVSSDATGLPLLLHHVFDLVLVLLLLLTCAAVGRAVLRRAGIRLRGPAEELAFPTAVGAGIASTALLIAGIGFLRPSIVLLLFLLLAFLGREEFRTVADAARCLPRYFARGTDAPLVLSAVAVVAAAGTVVIVLALAPAADWDSLMYHLSVPRRFAVEGRIVLPPDNLHVSRTGLIHMLYVPLLAAGSDTAPAVLSAGLALVLGLSVFSLCERFWDGETATLSVAAVIGTPMVLMVASTPRVDVSLALYLFLAHYAVLVWMGGRQKGARAEGPEAGPGPAPERWLYLAAVLTGFGFGIKYLGALYFVALLPLIAWSRFRGGQANRRPGRLAIFGMLVLVTSAPWLIKNQLIVGAPLYPFFAEPRLQPWLVPFFGGAEFPSSAPGELLQTVWELRRSFNLGDFFLSPGRLAIEPEGAFFFPSPLLLLLPLWLLSARDRVSTALFLPAALYLGALVVGFPRANPRYLLPSLVPLTLAAARGTVVGLRRLRVKRRARTPALAGLCLAALLVPVGLTGTFWLSRTLAVPHSLGRVSAEEFLTSHPVLEAHARMVRHANRVLPSDARILLLFDGRGHYFRRRVVQDNKMSNWPLLSRVPGGLDCLRRGGFTHVVVNPHPVRYRLQHGFTPEFFGWDEFGRFAERCLDPVHEVEGITLFRVRRPGAPPPEAGK